MNGSTSKIHSENPPNSLPKGAKSRLYELVRKGEIFSGISNVCSVRDG
jgi:hypothetical protein